jgi:hypothetical protein
LNFQFKGLDGWTKEEVSNFIADVASQMSEA